jgi:hypothetical protein
MMQGSKVLSKSHTVGYTAPVGWPERPAIMCRPMQSNSVSPDA